MTLHQPRVPYMDALRVVAALSVVVVHAVNPVVFSYDLISPSSWLLADFLNVLGRISVPLFVMLSGALLLDRSRSSEPQSSTNRRLKHIGILFGTWAVIYFVWRKFGLGQNIDLLTIIDSLVAGTPAEHLYFLPLIAGLYLITPLLRTVVHSLSLDTLTRYTALLLVLAGAWQLFGSLPDKMNTFNLINQFVPFIGYYLLGYVLAQQKVVSPRLAVGSYLCGLLLPVIATFIFIQNPLYKDSAFYMYDFIHPFIVLQSIGAWMLIQYYYPQVVARVSSIDTAVAYWSRVTLSLYLVHILILQLIALYIIDFAAAEAPVRYMAIQILGGGIVSIIVAWLLTKTPYFKKIVT